MDVIRNDEGWGWTTRAFNGGYGWNRTDPRACPELTVWAEPDTIRFWDVGEGIGTRFTNSLPAPRR